MRKILYISGTRADYGLMRETLISIAKNPGLKIEIVVTGMHLMPEFGNTIDEIKRDKFKIHIVRAVYRKDDRGSMVNFIGELILKLQQAVKKIRPDIILVLGDRAEMLAGAIVGSYLMIPVVHVHGGDVSSTVDEIRLFLAHASSFSCTPFFPSSSMVLRTLFLVSSTLSAAITVLTNIIPGSSRAP